MSTIIATDTSSDMEASEYTEKQIVCIPLPVTFGETVCDTMNKDLFFEKLIASDIFPQTSQPSPQTFLDLFQKAKENNDSLIVILISSVLSGTYQSALLARRITGYDRIFIIDSACATAAVKLLVDRAVSLRDAGYSAEEIVSEVEALKTRTKVFAVIDTLTYLCRGGRLSKAQANIGTLANLKPVITLAPDGSVQVIGKSIGRNRAIQAFLNNLELHAPDLSYPIIPLYSHDPANCSAMLERLHRRFPDMKTEEKMQIGAAIGTHIGPGAFGIAYIES